MQEEAEIQVIAEGAFSRLREMQGVLRVEGFDVEIVNPPEGKGSG